MTKILPILLALPLLLGCAVPEAHRQLNHQNIGAAKALLAIASAPGGDPVAFAAAVVSIATDIKANSETLEKNVTGKPAEPKEYTPQASKEAREASDKAAATPWWKVLLGGAGTFLLGLLTSGKLARFLPFLAGPVGSALSVVVEGIARVREKAQANGGTISLAGDDGLLAKLEEVAKKDPRVHELIKTWAHKAEEKLGLHL